jgi:VanZ family protein
LSALTEQTEFNKQDHHLKKIEPDKWKHFYVGIAMGAVLQAFFWFLLPGHAGLDTLLAFVISLFICYGFELFSRFTGLGHYDLGDVVAGMIGAVMGIGLVLIFQLN